MQKTTVLLFLLLVFVLANHLVWAAIVPFAGFPYGAPDEIHHFEVTRFIAQTGRMPIFGPDKDLYIRVRPGAEDTIINRIYGWQALFPPGAYILAGWLIRVLPPLQYPQQVFVARLFSVLCNVCLIYLAHRIAALAFPHDRFLVWGVPVLVGMIPQVVFVGSYHNPDALAMAATTASMLLGLRLVSEGWGRWTDALLLGLALSLVALAKMNGWLVSALFTSLVVLLSAKKVRALAARLPFVVGPPVLTLSLWFLFQQWHYGDILARNVFGAAWSADRPFSIPFAQQGYSFLTFLLRTNWVELTFKSFWGVFGYMSVRLSPAVYWGLLLVSLVSLAGLAKGVVARLKHKSLDLRSGRVQMVCLFAFVTVVLIIGAAVHSFYNDYQPQGRYLFPAIVPICSLLLLGWRELLPTSRARSAGLLLLCIVMPLFNLACLLAYVIPGMVVPVQEEWFF